MAKGNGEKARKKVMVGLNAVVTDLGRLREMVGKIEGKLEKVLEGLEPPVDDGEVEE